MSEDVEKKRDEFWEDFPLPYQEEDSDYEFARPSLVANELYKIVAANATILGQLDEVTATMARLEIKRDRAIRERDKIFREVLTEHFGAFKSSYTSSKVQEAFVYSNATSTQMERLVELDEIIEKCLQGLEAHAPLVARYKQRLIALKFKAEIAENWLNYQKYEGKMKGAQP